MYRFFVLLLIPDIRAILLNIPELGILEGGTNTTSWTNRTYYQFLGIRYGKSPSGDLRFQPPEFDDPWKGVYDATKFGRLCPQRSIIDAMMNSPPNTDHEDCLFINVFTPENPNEKNGTNLLPVLFFLHGGRYFEKGASTYHPIFLLEHNVIFVTPQYRLGPLGFMSLYTDTIAGNMGFLDQILALKWVNKYIKHFGGDNSKVTVMGSSAGASMAYIQLLSPLYSPRLFQQIILSSGSPLYKNAKTINPISYAKNLYSVITNTTESVSIDTMEEYFKTVPVIKIIKAMKTQIDSDPLFGYKFGGLVLQTSGKIRFFEESPQNLILSGKLNTIPMYISVTKNEGSYFSLDVFNALKNVNALNDSEYLRTNLARIILENLEINENSVFLEDMINNMYFKKIFERKEHFNFTDVVPGITDILGNGIIKARQWNLAKANTKFGGITYLSTFDYKGAQSKAHYGSNANKYQYDTGVFHADDLLYLIEHHKPLNEKDTKMAMFLNELMMNFVINGKPTSKLLRVNWPSLNIGENGPYLHVNSKPYVSPNFLREYLVTSLEAGLVNEKDCLPFL